MEEYKDIKGYEGLYQISNLGNVKSLQRVLIRVDGRKKTIKEKFIKKNINNNYHRVSLTDLLGNYKSFYIQRLVAETFLGYSELMVDHIDGNTFNNALSNLRYVTRSQNLTFRNTDIQYKSIHPYVTFDNDRKKKYKVFKKGVFLKRYYDLNEAIEQAKCLLEQPQ
jgi:hypothetical protein